MEFQWDRAQNGLRGQQTNKHTKHYATICIPEEGQLPQCIRCGIFSRQANTAKHFQSSTCQRFAVRRDSIRRQRAQDLIAQNVSFTINGRAIEQVPRFKYLGRILDEEDDDSHALRSQLAKARKTWGRFSHVLRSQGVRPRVRGYFYKAVIQPYCSTALKHGLSPIST